MKKKKLTYNSLALGNLKNRKKQYTLLIIGIILSMTLSSSFTFFVSSAISSALETHNFLYGKQSKIMVNTVTSDEIENYLNETTEKHGYAHIVGKLTSEGSETSIGSYVAWLDDNAKELYYQSLIEGRMPTKENEIAIEKSALTRLGVNYKLNGKITFDFYIIDAGSIKDEPIKKEYVLVGVLNDKRSNIEKQSWSSDINIPAAFVMDNTEVEIGGKEALHCFVLDNSDALMQDYIGLTRPLRKSYYGANNDGMGWYTTGGYEIMYTVADTFGMNAPYLLILVFVAVLSIAANIGIVNAFSTNLKERKKQIGLLRSVGATKKQIIKIYGKETFILCLISTPASILISVLAVTLSVGTFGENFIFKPSWWVLPLSAVISILIVVLSSFIPLFSASRITPMQAIRNISLNRKIKTKKIKTQKEFDTPKLLATRNIKLYKSKQVLTSVILAIAVFGSLFGFSLAGGIEKQNTSLNADYEVTSYMEYGSRRIANYDWIRLGISENEVQEILSNSFVENIQGRKETNGYIEVEELTDYLKLCNYVTGVYPASVNGVKITKENYEKYQEIPIENTAVIEKANITSPILPLDFIGLPEEHFKNESGTVLEGKINIDKLNSGEEVILVLPKTLELNTDYYTFEGEYSFSDLNVNSKSADVPDEEITILKTAELTNEFKVGDKIKLGWIISNTGEEPIDYGAEGTGAEATVTKENFDHEKIEKEVTVGAIIYEYSGLLITLFNGHCNPCLITTVDGLNTFTKNVPYEYIEVDLNTECTEEVNKEMTSLFDRIFAGKDAMVESLYEREKDNTLTVKTMYIIITAVVILLFTMCGSMINNALTARIRESKKEIGTLRAVGASTKEISSSYIRQVLSVLGVGTLTGASAFGLFFGIYTLIIISYGQTQDDYIITFWQTLIGIVLLIVFCVLNVYFKVKKEMKHSIVENIREL